MRQQASVGILSFALTVGKIGGVCINGIMEVNGYTAEDDQGDQGDQEDENL